MWSHYGASHTGICAGFDISNTANSPNANAGGWMDFGPNLVLREVIIGAQCHPTTSKAVEEALKPYGDSANCWWAGMRQDAFLLVKQDNPAHWHSSVG